MTQDTQQAATKNPDRAQSIIHFSVVGMALAMLAILLPWQAFDGRPQALQLHFNPLALLSLVSLISSSIAFLLIMRIKQRTNTLMWFATFLLSIMCWAGGEVMVRFSATPEASMFWSAATTPGSVFMPITLYMFVLAYTNSKHRFSPYTFPFLVGVSILFAYIDVHSHLVTDYTVQSFTSTPWGYVTHAGPAFVLITMWVSLLPLAAIGQLYHFKRKVTEPILRKQVSLFIFAIAIPLAGGTITDGLLPLLGIDAIPPLSVMLLTVMGVTISYGILRYRFFSFTPSLVAEQILGTMNEAVLGINPNFRISYANAGAEQLLGMPAGRLTTMRLNDFLEHHRTIGDLHTKLRKVLGDSEFATIEEIKLKIPDRPPTTAKMSITRLNDESQPYGYLIVMTDITALTDATAMIERQVDERTHQLHEAQAKLRASIEGLALGFALIGERKDIVIQNKALEDIFDLPQPAKSVQQLEATLTDLKLSDLCDSVFERGKSSEVKEVGMGAKVLHIFVAPVKISEHNKVNVIGTVILVQDITEEKVLARSRDEFFSIASHELRTPLTAIKGNASMMIDYYKDLLNKDQSFKEMVYDIHTSSGRLIEIVGDFLDASRIEQGRMVFRPQPVAIDKIIEFVFYEMRTIVNDKKINLTTNVKTLGTLPKAWVDKDRMTQIIYNLVGNAVKFTDKGKVTVEATVEGKHISLRVSDTGRGVPLENQKLLFHKFQQAGTSLLTRDTTRGTGLGLYISKLMAENMGGTVKLERSEEGKGSTFLLTMPVATEKQLNDARNGEGYQEKIDVSTGLSK